MEPIFPKGTKVVKGKVVQRKLPTSRMSEFKLREKEKIAKKFDSVRPTNDVLTGPGTEAYRADLTEAIRKTLAENRTGPRLAPGQQSTPKVLKKLGFDPEEGDYVAERGPMGDPRQQRELPKVKPGRPRPVLPERRDAVIGPNDDPMAPDDAPPTYLGGAKASDIRDRRKNPAMEGRGSGFLSKIQEAMGGKPMPAPLLEQLRGLDPAKLEKILAVIQESKNGSYKASKYVPREGQKLEAFIKKQKLKREDPNNPENYDNDIPF